MTTQKRTRLLTIAAVCCGGLLLADRLVLGPLVDACRHTARELEQTQAELARAESELALADRWSERLAEFRDRALPEDAPAAESVLVKHVRQWAAKTHLDVTSMRPQWRDDNDQLPLLQLRVTGVGSMDAIARFLYIAETASLPVRTLNVSLAAGSGGGDRLVLTLDLEAILWAGDASGGGTS